ncbi:L-lactate dehydrogenase [Piscirickettsia litoralis]|uniref:L-lactate dehydrogenase n=1 Tax=Piscirickettsia litoralis TaxID=1891921 RepID=A0ABX3A771_9GAMM|nr:L-lactate dehydrogenase [Piscirickettsia litoralis]ODN43285.1 L-lactate dehydrogenase [Piscirickettsia litoralis]
MKSTRIAIIGVGSVGATTAYAITLRRIPAELLLIDVDCERTQGEEMDLIDALSFNGGSSIRKADLSEAKTASIIVITAGSNQRPGETRVDLLNRNKEIMRSIFSKIGKLPENCIVVMATNPADVMALTALKCSGLPPHQVFSSGTLLDTYRLRGSIADTLNLSISSIHAYILGEHGDSQFPAWSLSMIGGIPIKELNEFDKQRLEQYATETSNRAYKITNRKGATYYGIGACLASICKKIIYDKRAVLPLSVYHQEHDIYFSVPVVLGASGILRHMPLNLPDNEKEKLNLTIEKLKKLS